MSNHLTDRSALYAGRDFLVGLGLFAIVAFAFAADFDHVWPSAVINPPPPHAVSSQIMASAHAQTTLIAHENTITLSLIDVKSSGLSVEPARHRATSRPFTLTYQQLAMFILALMFATITFAIQRSARHLRAIVAAPRPRRRKRRTRDFMRSNSER